MSSEKEEEGEKGLCTACGEKVDYSLPCGHYTHRECIAKSMNTRCHVCRTDLGAYGYTCCRAAPTYNFYGPVYLGPVYGVPNDTGHLEEIESPEYSSSDSEEIDYPQSSNTLQEDLKFIKQVLKESMTYSRKRKRTDDIHVALQCVKRLKRSTG